MPRAISIQQGERSALVMVGACVLVALCVLGILAIDHRDNQIERIESSGVSITRILSGLPTDDLADTATYQNVLQLISYSLDSEWFAYAALVDTTGELVAHVSAPNIIVPFAGVSPDPSGWIGEREFTLEGGGGDVLEFYAPVFNSRDLAGQIRLGFALPGLESIAHEVSVAGGLALIVFLLAPLFYVLLRREIRPLAAAGEEIERLIEKSHSRELMAVDAPIGAFMDRFNQFVAFSQGRIQELENDRGELVASAKLISFKKTRMESVLQTLPDAVMILDEHGKVTYANDRVSLFLGVAREEVLSSRPRSWCKDKAVVDFLARYETTTAPRFTDEIVSFESSHIGGRTMAITGYPLFSVGGAAPSSGTLVMIRDVTQEALAQQSRSEFVAHLGHELKTPLNTLSLYSEVLMDGSGQSESERIEAVNTIHDEVERLAGLVNNLLSITRIEMGSMDLDKQRTRLNELLSDIADNLGRTASTRDITIDINVPGQLSPVDVDKDLLRIAINNLVSNAIKYNQTGGRVTIAADEDDEAIRIRVTDNGVGISEADQSRIFNKFFRSQSHEVRERTGHGLGLSLARQIVELHDGEISVESRLGEGTTFTVSLWKRFGLVKKAI